jgi:hypothetical protein
MSILITETSQRYCCADSDMRVYRGDGITVKAGAVKLCQHCGDLWIYYSIAETNKYGCSWREKIMLDVPTRVRNDKYAKVPIVYYWYPNNTYNPYPVKPVTEANY